MELSILTYNIHKGFSVNNKQFVLHSIRDQIREVNADIAMLQEVIGEHSVHASNTENWPENTQYEFLADQVWHHHAYGKNAIADGRHHGNAILSKYPFTAWDNINISPYPKASRSLLHGDITIPEDNRKIHVVCLHLGLLGIERRTQLRKLNDHLESIVDQHDALIIGGDFNDWSSKQVARHLNSDLGLDEIFLKTQNRYAKTFPAKWPLLCVDRIYYKGLSPVSAECLNGQHWKQLSDHVPLLARFKF